MAQTPSTFAFQGGLDLASAALAVPPGRVIASINYEPLAEGYGRLPGFERFDGSGLPSEEAFWTLPFDQGGIPIAEGDVVVGDDSLAVGTVMLNPEGFTGSWDDNTGAGTLVLAGVAGAFEEGETLTVGGIAVAGAAGPSVEGSAATAELVESYTEAAQAYRRALVDKVPGSGPVRGVAWLNGELFAWRDNAGATAAGLWKATANGWLAVALGRVINFTAGLVEINEGDVLVGASSGANATVKRIVRNSGDWGSTAAGYIVVSAIVGPMAGGEGLKVGATPVATAGTISNVVIPAGGRYDILGENFYGAADRYRLYGANGTAPGFEFDGEVYVQIRTGMVDDRPTRAAVIANHLFFGFRGGSLQFSAPGEPLLWDVVIGAGEIGLGTELTNLVSANDSALAVFGASRIGILQGRDVDTFQFDLLTKEAGAEPWTAQRIGTTIYVDQRGLRSMTATQAFGNFKTGALSEIIEPYFRAKRKAGATCVLSYVVKSKSQYRLIWSDGTGLTVYMGRKAPEALPFDLDDVRPFCACVAELSQGQEGVFIGGEDGYVYRFDSGPNFDGTAVRFLMTTPFNHLGSPMIEKRYHGAKLELQCPPGVKLSLAAEFDYADGSRPPAANEDFLLDGGGASWDFAEWDGFYWSSAYEGFAESWFDGIGRNISLVIAGESRLTEEPHVLQTYTLFSSPRRMKR